MQTLRELKLPFFTILFLFGFLYLFSFIFGPLPFSVNSVTTNKTDLFTVTGAGEATGIPDTALLSFGVTKQATTVQQAQNEVNTVANKITQDLKNLGVKIKNIKTTNYSVNPNYDFSTGKQTVNGYTVSQNMEVRLQPIEQANKAIDVATADGANVVGGVTFVLDDATQDRLEQQARKDAIDKAKKKAQETAQLAGIRLGKIINVTESTNDFPRPVYAMETKALPLGGGEPTEVTPGENTVRITISLSYQTL
ncbi:MAG: SIMPL domain-containing protein [bacterium]|nr:SIMPL domain-containing protein [bacterium]